jgi:hypothetical protein
MEEKLIADLITDVESDKKSVLLSAGIPLIFGILCAQFYTSILAYCSAYGFYLYYRALHCTRLELTKCLRDEKIDEAYAILKIDFWPKYKWRFDIATWLGYMVPIAYFIER